MVHPMHGPNRFKLGIFSANADGGLTLTRVPERWPAHWNEVVEVAQMADRAGIEFFLPIARWKGFGGEMNSRRVGFRNTDLCGRPGWGHAADRAVFHGAWCRWCIRCSPPRRWRQLTTPRAGGPGFNIVCGWSPQEFALFGLTMIEDR